MLYLDGDASGEVFNLVLKLELVLLESGDVVLDSVLLVTEGFQ